jgi:transcriptional regulator GlxA family with amidase domain
MVAMDPRIVHTLAVIEGDCAQRLTVTRLAAQFRLSRSRFEHLFKKQTGETFRSHLRGVRLAHAKSLLTDYSLSIKEVAARCGYSSGSSLARDFRKFIHSSPSKYRDSTF